jgi:hypothetical protein
MKSSRRWTLLLLFAAGGPVSSGTIGCAADIGPIPLCMSAGGSCKQSEYVCCEGLTCTQGVCRASSVAAQGQGTPSEEGALQFAAEKRDAHARSSLIPGYRESAGADSHASLAPD